MESGLMSKPSNGVLVVSAVWHLSSNRPWSPGLMAAQPGVTINVSQIRLIANSQDLVPVISQAPAYVRGYSKESYVIHNSWEGQRVLSQNAIRGSPGPASQQDVQWAFMNEAKRGGPVYHTSSGIRGVDRWVESYKLSTRKHDELRDVEEPEEGRS